MVHSDAVNHLRHVPHGMLSVRGVGEGSFTDARLIRSNRGHGHHYAELTTSHHWPETSRFTPQTPSRSALTSVGEPRGHLGATRQFEMSLRQRGWLPSFPLWPFLPFPNSAPSAIREQAFLAFPQRLAPCSLAHLPVSSLVMSSSPSWHSDSSNDRPSPVRFSDSSSPAPSWSSERGGHSSATRQPATGGVPPRRGPVRAGRAAVGRNRPETGGSSRARAGSPTGTASTVTGQELVNIRARYQIPREIGLFPPTPDDRVVSSRPGRVACYEICFRLGLRPPFHPFFINLLDYYSLTPSQLVPNSLRIICAFIILCHLHSIAPRISLFRAFYILRSQGGRWLFQPRSGRALRLLLPSSVKGWKPRFFFANIDQVRAVWGEPDLRPNSNSTVVPGDKEAFGQLLTTELPRYNLLLSEENLRLAGITARSGE